MVAESFSDFAGVLSIQAEAVVRVWAAVFCWSYGIGAAAQPSGSKLPRHRCQVIGWCRAWLLRCFEDRGRIPTLWQCGIVVAENAQFLLDEKGHMGICNDERNQK
jgi:hypothetical protein